jgi:hypothetical protein
VRYIPVTVMLLATPTQVQHRIGPMTASELHGVTTRQLSS